MKAVPPKFWTSTKPAKITSVFENPDVSIIALFLIHHRNMSDKKALDSGSDTHDVTEGQIFSHSDGDVAAAYADKLEGEDAYTTKEENRLRWKLDMRLVPILWLNITLSAMDKVTTSTAALYGMKTATNLTGNRYSWVGSAFYVSS